MNFKIYNKDFITFIKNAYDRINKDKDYITELDSATGDGDHWANINMGYEKLVEISPELEKLSLEEMFKKIGMTMMSNIGGSSGVLYGGSYIAASKVLAGKDFIDKNTLENILEEQLKSMKSRGQCEIGNKTMIDSLSPALDALKQNINNDDIKATLTLVKEKALEGANATKDMPAVKGRASYQTNKGIGHLDPGAVTMSYQIEELMNVAIANIES